MKRLLPLAILAALLSPARAAEDGTYEGKDVAQWLAVLQGKSEKERPRAAAALARIGRSAMEAIPALAKALGSAKNEDLRVNAALALGKVGTADDEMTSRIGKLPDLPGGMPHPETPPPAADPAAAERSESVRKTAVPALVKALADPAMDVRTNAAFSLGLFGEDGAGAAKALLKALGDKDDSLRANAAVALTAMPNAPEDAVPALGKMLADSYAGAANAACNALRARGAKALPVLKQIEEALVREVEKPRFQGPKGLPPGLGAQVGRGSFGGMPPISVSLCLLLGDLGKDAAPALPALFKALKATHDGVRNAAIQSIGSIRSDPEKSVAALTGVLEDSNEANSGLAALTLADFGPDARPALPALKKLFERSSGVLKQNAEYAIDRIGGKAVATGEGEVRPAPPGGSTTHGGSSGNTKEVWR